MDIKKLIDLYDKQNTIADTAREYCKLFQIEYSDSFRRKVSKILSRHGLTSEINTLKNETTTETSQYESEVIGMPSAWSKDKNRFYTIEEYCDVYGLDKNTVKSAKLVSHNASHMVYNIAFYTEEEESLLDIDKHLDEIISKYVEPISLSSDFTKNTHLDDEWFDRLVYTDVHIGMNVNGKSGDSMYEGKWDKEELLSRLQKMIEHVITYQKSKTLVIDDLGDFLDGLGGQTTRKGHELPQNMNDKEVFDLGIEFKVTLIDSLIPYYDKIICNDITNDNHSGFFAYFVSSAFEKIMKERYPDNVEVVTRKRFIEHYSIYNHTFVISHGKDIGEQKFGLKPKLDAVQAEKIDQYCKENRLYNGNFIEFSKVDSHQALYDDTTSNDFHYYNYPAFSPPSNWVKTNFGNSKSGFRFYNIKKGENIKIAIPYWF